MVLRGQHGVPGIEPRSAAHKALVVLSPWTQILRMEEARQKDEAHDKNFTAGSKYFIVEMLSQLYVSRVL